MKVKTSKKKVTKIQFCDFPCQCEIYECCPKCNYEAWKRNVERFNKGDKKKL